MRKVDDLTKDELTSLTKNGRSVMFFTASWCGDCKFIKPAMPDIETDFSDVDFTEVDVDDSIDMAQEMNIFGIPSFVAYQDGKEVGRLVNKDRKTKKEIEDFLKSVY